MNMDILPAIADEKDVAFSTSVTDLPERMH